MDEAMDTSSDTADLLSEPHAAISTSPILERRAVTRTSRHVAFRSGWLTTVQSPSSSHSSMVEDAPTLPSPVLNGAVFSDEQNEVTGGINSVSSVEVTDQRVISQPIIIDLVSPVAAPSAENFLVASEDLNVGNVYEIVSDTLPGSVETHFPSTSHVQDVRVVEFRGGAQISNINPLNVQSELIITGTVPEEPTSSNIEGDIAPNEQQNVDVENLPLAQRIRSPEPIAVENSPPPKKIKPDSDLKLGESDGEDEGKQCPICFDVWTNSGDHRLVSLRCGHLFGQHCIQHWLQIHKVSERTCPQCKKKASIKDLRQLYASKIKVLDTSEQEALKATIKKLEEERDRLTRELAYERQLNQEAMRIQQEQQLKLRQWQNQGLIPQLQTGQQVDSSSQSNLAQIRINLLHRVEVSREGGCRVLAFNAWKEVLVASQSSSNLFADYGIRMIDTREFRLRQLMPMHSKAIRDLAFNELRKDLLVSVSLDRTAKIYCMSSNASIMTFNTEVPLWSCCWDSDNSNIFFAGSQNGIVFQYDIRNTHTEVNRLTTQGDTAPVISLASVPAGDWLPRGGFFSCRLNRLRLYERVNSAEFNMLPVEVDGPFSALNYNHKTKCMLLSTRPTVQNPHAHHQLYQMASSFSRPQYNKVHSLIGGTTQRVMSRPCQLVDVGKGKHGLICAYQESEAHVAVWSAATGHKIPAGTLQCAEPVMDLCPVNFAEQNLLATLSDKNLRVYQFS